MVGFAPFGFQTKKRETRFQLPRRPFGFQTKKRPEGPLAFAPTGGQRSGPKALWLSPLRGDKEAARMGAKWPEGPLAFAPSGPL